MNEVILASFRAYTDAFYDLFGQDVTDEDLDTVDWDRVVEFHAQTREMSGLLGAQIDPLPANLDAVGRHIWKRNVYAINRTAVTKIEQRLNL